MPAPVRRRRRPTVSVLRVGHRPGRDPRLTTHLALAARAFGAARLFLHPPDSELAARIDAVTSRWGGRFQVVGAPSWADVVRDFRGTVVHLTMYGEPLKTALPRLRRVGTVLVVVGGAKVPPGLFELADLNVGIGAQPHSEVAALAVLLHQLLGDPSVSYFRGAQRRIVPQRRGKRVLVQAGSRSR